MQDENEANQVIPTLQTRMFEDLICPRIALPHIQRRFEFFKEIFEDITTNNLSKIIKSGVILSRDCEEEYTSKAIKTKFGHMLSDNDNIYEIVHGSGKNDLNKSVLGILDRIVKYHLQEGKDDAITREILTEDFVISRMSLGLMSRMNNLWWESDYNYKYIIRDPQMLRTICHVLGLPNDITELVEDCVDLNNKEFETVSRFIFHIVLIRYIDINLNTCCKPTTIKRSDVYREYCTTNPFYLQTILDYNKHIDPNFDDISSCIEISLPKIAEKLYIPESMQLVASKIFIDTIDLLKLFDVCVAKLKNAKSKQCKIKHGKHIRLTDAERDILGFKSLVKIGELHRDTAMLRNMHDQKTLEETVINHIVRIANEFICGESWQDYDALTAKIRLIAKKYAVANKSISYLIGLYSSYVISDIYCPAKFSNGKSLYGYYPNEGEHLALRESVVTYNTDPSCFECNSSTNMSATQRVEDRRITTGLMSFQNQMLNDASDTINLECKKLTPKQYSRGVCMLNIGFRVYNYFIDPMSILTNFNSNLKIFFGHGIWNSKKLCYIALSYERRLKELEESTMLDKSVIDWCINRYANYISSAQDFSTPRRSGFVQMDNSKDQEYIIRWCPGYATLPNRFTAGSSMMISVMEIFKRFSARLSYILTLFVNNIKVPGLNIDLLEMLKNDIQFKSDGIRSRLILNKAIMDVCNNQSFVSLKNGKNNKSILTGLTMSNLGLLCDTTNTRFEDFVNRVEGLILDPNGLEFSKYKCYETEVNRVKSYMDDFKVKMWFLRSIVYKLFLEHAEEYAKHNILICKGSLNESMIEQIFKENFQESYGFINVGFCGDSLEKVGFLIDKYIEILKNLPAKNMFNTPSFTTVWDAFLKVVCIYPDMKAECVEASIRGYLQKVLLCFIFRLITASDRNLKEGLINDKQFRHFKLYETFMHPIGTLNKKDVLFYKNVSDKDKLKKALEDPSGIKINNIDLMDYTSEPSNDNSLRFEVSL